MSDKARPAIPATPLGTKKCIVKKDAQSITQSIDAQSVTQSTSAQAKNKQAKKDARVVRELGHFKKLRKIGKLLRCLHDDGCARDKAGNRELHFDEYVLLILFWFFNPGLDSMRALYRAMDSEEVQKKLGVKRFSLGSFSEACRVFEPAKLQVVVGQMYKRMAPVSRQNLLNNVPGIVELVDGTVLPTLRSVTAAMWLPPAGYGQATHAYKLHIGFEIDKHVPTSLVLTDARGRGNSGERNVLRNRLLPGRTYVADRGYQQVALFNAIHAIGSNYVFRVPDQEKLPQIIKSLVLSAEDIAAKVISDQIIMMGKAGNASDHPIRLVCVETTPHTKRGKADGPPSDGVLRIATDLLDVPAHIIAFLYSYRWTLEIFIRFLKQVLGCRHLLSTKTEGIEIQIYAAVIACMMLNIITGKKPNKAMFELLHQYLNGWHSEAHVIRTLNKPDNTGVKLRAEAEAMKKMSILN